MENTPVGKTIDVAVFIDRHKLSGFQLRILILCIASVLFAGFNALSIGYVVPSLVAKWGANKAAFGPVFSTGLLAMGFGAMLFSAIADRIGRKKVVVFCLAFVGVFTVLKVVATSVTTLLLFHCLGGFGAGGVMPICCALMTEYSPKNRRAFMVMMVTIGYAIGGSSAGFVAAKFLGIYGWQSVFYIGGIAALLGVPLALVGLPESIRFLALRQDQNLRLLSILKKIDSTLPAESEVRLISTENKGEGVPVVQLFRHGRAPTTLLLWVTTFMALSIIYFMTPWLPVILHDRGLPVRQASIGTAIFSIGGVLSSPTVGPLMDLFGTIPVLIITFTVAALFIFSVGWIGGGSFTLLCILIFGAGFCTVGSYNGTAALATQLYPTFMRSTGVGWAMGIGRFCAGISPMVAAFLITRQWSHESLFSVFAIPAATAAVAIVLIKVMRRRASARAAEVTPKLETEASAAN